MHPHTHTLSVSLFPLPEWQVGLFWPGRGMLHDVDRPGCGVGVLRFAVRKQTAGVVKV